MEFNYQTNKIINGVCEYCGVLAEKCVHYRDGQVQPMDELKKLELSPNPPPQQKLYPVEPLRPDELAASAQEAAQKAAQALLQSAGNATDTEGENNDQN